MQIAWFLEPYYIVICGLSSTTLFSTLYQKRHDLEGGELWNTKCVFWFSLQISSETFLILRRTERDIIINVHKSSEVPVILARFEIN